MNVYIVITKIDGEITGVKGAHIYKDAALGECVKWILRHRDNEGVLLDYSDNGVETRDCHLVALIETRNIKGVVHV